MIFKKNEKYKVDLVYSLFSVEVFLNLNACHKEFRTTNNQLDIGFHIIEHL